MVWCSVMSPSHRWSRASAQNRRLTRSSWAGVCTLAFFLVFFLPKLDHQPLVEHTFQIVRSQALKPESLTSSAKKR